MHAVRDYDSTELAMEEGSEVLVIEEYGEWALVDAGDRVGWIPSACLDR
ncbi:MAG: SH3 domain-containing protein [Akkermansiaceae bacterium]|nr:SH3 domain-containing protein [Akkermansiaceae bacterium]